MATYILLSTLTPQGAQTLQATPERLIEVNREIEALGARVVKQWAVLGPYDFVSVVEAPDERVILQVSLALGSRGSARFETLGAIPVDEFIRIAGPGES